MPSEVSIERSLWVRMASQPVWKRSAHVMS
jgi:hypothetical protein